MVVVLGGSREISSPSPAKKKKNITILDTAVITISLVEIIIIITQYITYSKSLIN